MFRSFSSFRLPEEAHSPAFPPERPSHNGHDEQLRHGLFPHPYKQKAHLQRKNRPRAVPRWFYIPNHQTCPPHEVLKKQSLPQKRLFHAFPPESPVHYLPPYRNRLPQASHESYRTLPPDARPPNYPQSHKSSDSSPCGIRFRYTFPVSFEPPPALPEPIYYQRHKSLFLPFPHPSISKHLFVYFLFCKCSIKIRIPQERDSSRRAHLQSNIFLLCECASIASSVFTQ